MDYLKTISQLVIEYINNKEISKKWTPGVDWVQYSGPYFNSEEITRAVKTLLDGWLVLGKEADEFESKFPSLLGKKYGVFVNSGSSANLLMMAATLKQLDTYNPVFVIVPAAGFPTTVNPLLQLGCIPIWVDIELDTLNINLDEVEKYMPGHIITFAHVLGNPPNMNRLMKMVNENNLILLEDCCDALGSTYNGTPLGSFGKYSSCSFYPAHHMTTGEGGFVACNTIEDERLLRSLRDWGRGCYCSGKAASLSMNGSCGKRFSNWLPLLKDNIFDHKYVYDNIGYNLKPIELQASLGLEQIKKLPDIHNKRKENHKRLSQIFAPYEEYFHFHKATPGADVSWFAFPLTLRDGISFNRAKFTQYLENHKIQTRNYFGGNLLLHPGYERYYNEYKELNYKSNLQLDFKVATKVTIDTFFLGTSPVITSEQLDYIETIVSKFFKQI